MTGEGEDGEGDREVEVGTVFFKIGGGEVDGDFLVREGETGA